MSHLESQLQAVQGSKCFANLDLAHCYRQVPLEKESQEMMYIQTPCGVFSFNRLLQGGIDRRSNFQAILSEKFEGRVKHIIQWVGDLLLFEKDEKELFHNIEA